MMDSVSLNDHWLGIQGIACCSPKEGYLASLDVNGDALDPTILPPLIRRRTSVCTKMVVTALHKACLNAGVEPDLPVVSVSSMGESRITADICSAIAGSRYPLSPTQFHNSVHNTPTGYWSIATGSNHSMTSMAAMESNLAVGLIEAWTQLVIGTDKILMVIYDEDQPDALASDFNWRPIAFAFVLSRDKSRYCLSLPQKRKSLSSRTVKTVFADNNPALKALEIVRPIQSGAPGKYPIGIACENDRWDCVLEIFND